VFTFFDHTGDVGIEIDAPDPGALFADAARAFSETITDREALPGDDAVEISLVADAADLLLVDWLNELLFRFETDGWLPRDVAAQVSRAGDTWTLSARLAGGRLDPARHDVRVLVKAVTYHGLQVQELASRWRARIILDI
jgi:SHS2 domain-containing protein